MTSMDRIKRITFCLAVLATALPICTAHALSYGDKLSLHGYVSNQTGMFTEATAPGERFNNKGTLSMQRNTLWLEGHWNASSWADVHTIFRGVVSGSLPADRNANIPGEAGSGAGAAFDTSQETVDPRARMRAIYYNQLMLR